MQGKKMPGASVVTMVTESVAQAALRRGAAADLAPQEEKLLRMRLGAGLPLSARLERIAAATDAEIEVLAYEIEAYLRWKDGQPRAARASPTPAPAPSTSRVKEKIVRALRKKT